MERYKVILFDLDGTLSDPKVGITKSVQYALHTIGIEELDTEKLTCFIGPPLQDSFTEFYHLDEDRRQKAIEFYRERFKEIGMYENELYTDIPLLLNSLKNQGMILVVATSKPTIFAEQILKYFKIEHHFDMIVGSNLDGTRSSKTEIIRYILDQYKDYHPSDFVMIGDKMHDIIGAINNGIASIGVTYGYGSYEELSLSKADYIVESVIDLKVLLQGE